MTVIRNTQNILVIKLSVSSISEPCYEIWLQSEKSIHRVLIVSVF